MLIAGPFSFTNIDLTVVHVCFAEKSGSQNGKKIIFVVKHKISSPLAHSLARCFKEAATYLAMKRSFELGIEDSAHLRHGPMQLNQRDPMQQQFRHQRLKLFEDEQDPTNWLLLPNIRRIDGRI